MIAAIAARPAFAVQCGDIIQTDLTLTANLNCTGNGLRVFGPLLGIGDHAMLVNGATLGGHVIVEEWAVVGALCPVHQFVRIGAHSYVGGGTTITQDVLPFSMTSAARETHAYLMNKVGLQRRGFSKERIAKIHHAYKVLLASKMNTSQALEKLKSEADRGEDVDMLIRFIEASERGVIK